MPARRETQSHHIHTLKILKWISGNWITYLDQACLWNVLCIHHANHLHVICRGQENWLFFLRTTILYLCNIFVTQAVSTPLFCLSQQKYTKLLFTFVGCHFALILLKRDTFCLRGEFRWISLGQVAGTEQIVGPFFKAI